MQEELVSYIADLQPEIGGLPGTEWGTNREIKSVVKLHERIPAWSGIWRGIPLFFKEEFTDLGRHASIDHESKIANQVNQLLEYIPNFSTGFAEVTCVEGIWNRPLCQKEGVQMLITEFYPEPLLRDWMRSRSFKEALSMFIQINRAMEIARNRIGLIHGDLQTQNIVVRDLQNSYLINYDGLLIQARYLPILN